MHPEPGGACVYALREGLETACGIFRQHLAGIVGRMHQHGREGITCQDALAGPQSYPRVRLSLIHIYPAALK